MNIPTTDDFNLRVSDELRLVVETAARMRTIMSPNPNVGGGIEHFYTQQEAIAEAMEMVQQAHKTHTQRLLDRWQADQKRRSGR